MPVERSGAGAGSSDRVEGGHSDEPEGANRMKIRMRVGHGVAAVAVALTAVASTGTSAVAGNPGPAQAGPARLPGFLAHPIAVTDKGLVRGAATATMRAFKGIPYAAAPVGDLRWRAPQPAHAWRGVRDASQFAPHCAQVGGSFGLASTSEDCLFLNVYSPAGFGLAQLRRAPVMVWIHGGALVTGLSDSYDPTQLVAQGVVVVTINYRLGELGFLTHPALSAEQPDGASGDYGLMDQQAALRWVQRNIANFGGDRGNVTIFGESAGGLSVHSQLVSPGAHGLFDKAIVESGAYNLDQASLRTAQQAGTGFAASVGCASQTAACLRALPVAAILARQPTGITPDVDGRVLPMTVRQAFSSGRFNQVPVVEGSNHDEWRLFVAITELTTGAPLTAAGYVPAIQATLGVPAATAQALAGAYPLSAFPSPSLALATLGTDAIFACNSRVSARMLSQFVPTFQYEFNDPNAPNIFLPAVSFPTGSYHASEIPYVFRTASVPFTPAQIALSRNMVFSWAHFATVSDPAVRGSSQWPRFAGSDRFQALTPRDRGAATGFAADHKCAVWGSP
jgi:para-nitrobenzyl esterase